MLITMDESYQSQKQTLNPLLILPKLFLIISIVLLMWIVIVLSGVSVLELDPDWAGLSLSSWLLVISILFGAFIIIDILMYVSPQLFTKQNIQKFTTADSSTEYLDGKKVYEYTFPKNRKGGIFSKTYVQIDSNSLVRIRNQMIPAEKLWPEEKQENNENEKEKEE
ncbi:MAG: hypothetical protein KGY67_02205 [Candidatus Thermoplasmatota archaeon]|nr:hypothetical protein [Candidatus Thermoplasmatota archaeon]